MVPFLGIYSQFSGIYSQNLEYHIGFLLSFSISFENSLVITLVASLKLVYHLFLVAFKIFSRCLGCLEFYFDASGCVFILESGLGFNGIFVPVL